MAIAVALVPTLAQSQGRTPTADSAAVGGEVGVFLARDSDLASGIDLSGFYEYYLSSRTSIRLVLGWMHPEYEDSRDPNASVRYVRVGGDFIHNWEGGAIHPFVGAGLGVYILQGRDNGQNVGESESKLGGTLLGGVELFTNRTTAVKFEGRYHLISNARRFDPDGLSLTVGLKKYF